jgi:glycosyltransferase involved in cell wall biosynthesis
MLAILTLAFSTHPRYRWVKYAGNWKPDRGGANDPWSCAFQRWWLNRRLHRGTVTVNGEWPDQPGHVFAFLNPSFTEKEIRAAQCNVEKKKLEAPYRPIFAGRVESEKGIGRALEVCNRLNRNNVPFVFDIIGDGPERSHFEEVSRLSGLESSVTFHGWLSQQEVQRHFREAHFMLLPTSASEGWPKVLSEAMALGVVVLAGAVSSIPQNLQKTGAGVALPPEDIDGFEMNIMTYMNNPGVWKTASESGIAAAKLFSYETYLDNVRAMFRKAWNVVL